MDWIPFELHTHTCHTDGELHPEELLTLAAADGLRGLALTDHNTASCDEAFDKGLRDQPGMIGIHGVEWTTYYGHMLVLGENGRTEWRGVKPDQLDRAVDSIHAHGGLVGIAHPYALSNPINTGYRWGFQLQDWDRIDYIEVWSRDFAPLRTRSKNAFALWDAMLREGYHIAATSGRDWHRQDDTPKHYSVTYIGLQPGEQNAAGALDAIRRGRLCVTAGPLFTASLQQGGQTAYPGDTVPAGEGELAIRLDGVGDVARWRTFSIIPQYWRIIANGECVAEGDCGTSPYLVRHTLQLFNGWLRVELYGTYLDKQNEKIAFTNPFYIY